MKTLSVILLLLFSISCFAQPDKQSNFWYFGDFAGLDFSSGNPTLKTDGYVIALFRGSSAASDESGNLILYSDGEKVWNRYHEVIKGGENLGGGSILSNHNGLIVPHPKFSSQYYVFYIPDADYSGKAEIKYATVDLSINGGKGGVTTSNNTLAKNLTRTYALLRHCNNKDFWLITHETGNNKFQAYLINESGLNTTPVVSSLGSIHNGGISNIGQLKRYTTMKPSFDSNKLAVSIIKEESTDQSFVEIIDFDNKTGKFTQVSYKQNWHKFPTGGVNDMVFTADNKKIYVSRTSYKKIDAQNEEYQSDLFQVDLTQKMTDDASLTAITSKIFKIDALKSDGPHAKGIGGLQMGLNGKIYVAYNLSNYLGIINNPNNYGTACNFVEKGFSLAPKSSGWTLPSLIPSKRASGSASISYKLSPDGCNGTMASSIYGLDKTKIINYQWYQDGKPITNANDSVYKVKQPGTYHLVVSEKNGCLSASSGTLRVFGETLNPPKKKWFI